MTTPISAYFSGPLARPPAVLVNHYSSGGVAALGVGFHRGKTTLSGALVAATLATVLNITGPGVVSFLGAYSIDATARTIRLQVILDGVTVFDATSSSTSSANEGLCAIGHAGRDNSGGASYLWLLDPTPFNTSLVVKVATSVASETDKIGVGHLVRI